MQTLSNRLREVPGTATLLGWLGLLPFLALPLLIAGMPEYRALCQTLLADYAFGILCFLLGIWWGIGVMRGEPRPLLLSNLLFLVLLAARTLLQNAPFMVIAATLFIAIIVLEHSLAVFQRQPAYYARMRIQLSLVAAVSLLTVAFVLH